MARFTILRDASWFSLVGSLLVAIVWIWLGAAN
jgi:hypothetical protein